MYIEDQTNSGNHQIPLETRMLTQRRIFLEGEIQYSTVGEFYQKLTYLSLEDPYTPIRIYINSPGGSVDAGLAILDIIRSCNTPIEMYCVGIAYSMAAVIFGAGTHGRFMLPHAKLMIHQPLVGQNMGGNATDIQSLSKSLMETKKELNQILADSTGKTLKQIDQATKYDHFFTAKEAVEFGLCDQIVGFEDFKGETK